MRSSFFKLLFWQTKLLEEFPDESGVKDPSKRILPFLPGTYISFWQLYHTTTSCPLKVTVYLQIDNFLQISIFRLKEHYDQNEISNVKKKSLKKIKYWQRNGGFKFWREPVKGTLCSAHANFTGFFHRKTIELSLCRVMPTCSFKYWQRNSGFKFWQEVKITRLIDIFSVVFSHQLFHLKRTL